MTVTDISPATRRRSMALLMLIMVIDSMGIGIIMPVMPDLLRDVLGGSLAQAALWGGILMSSYAVMQLLFSPTLGSLSDRFGRRPVLLVSIAVIAVDYVVMGVAWTITLLVIARLVAGIASSTYPTAVAFVADISDGKEKATNFGLLGASFGIGFVMGPMIGGFLGEFGTRAPFFAAAGMAALAFIVGLFILPETVTDATRRNFEWARANPLGAFRAIRKLPGLERLLVFSFLYEFAFLVYPVVWAYFGAARFGWGPGMIGFSLAVYGISMALVQGVLIRPTTAILGDRGTVIVGMFLSLAMLVALGFVTNGVLAIAITPLAALGAVVDPALQSMMSRRAGDDQQGELQGVMASIGAIAMIGSPLVMTAIFSAFTSDDRLLYLPGAPFLFAALLSTICIAILLTTPRADHITSQ